MTSHCWLWEQWLAQSERGVEDLVIDRAVLSFSDYVRSFRKARTAAGALCA
jgi:hypothetical protein